MNFVDDGMIEAAHAPRKKLRHYTPALIAACLCVVIVATFPVLRELIDLSDKSADALPPGAAVGNGSNGSGSVLDGWLNGSQNISPDPPGLGDTIRLGGTSVTLDAYTDTTATLTVVKTDSEPLYMAMRQYGGGILASTEPDFRDNGIILRPAQIKLYVNDAVEWVDDLPHEPGEYHVLVDYATVMRTDYVVGHALLMYSYGGEDGSVIAEWLHCRDTHSFGQETSEESETTPDTTATGIVVESVADTPADTTD